MSNENWTKGEWVVHDNGNFFDIGVKRDSDILPAYPRVCIGVPYYLEANAYLIAAAPKLYLAAKTVNNRIPTQANTDCGQYSFCLTEEEVAFLRDALAKSRGEL